MDVAQHTAQMQGLSLRGLLNIFFYSYHILTKPHRNGVVFSVLKGTTVNTIDDSYFRGTVGEFFGQLKSDNLISETDISNHKVSVRLYVYSRNLYIEVVCSKS